MSVTWTSPPARRQALLVLGMHRAGTSALARIFALRGATLPADVLPPNEGNVDGYWEPRGVVELNDRILEACDTSWDDPFAPQRLAAERAIVAAFRDEAVAVLEREYGSANLIVLKDPRCTLLREFWCEAVAARGYEPLPVAIMRPYADVVASLVRRDATSAESASWLYVAYGLEVARAIAAGASSVTYAQLTTDWRATTGRIAAELGVEWPEVTVETATSVAAYLRPATAKPPVLALPQPLPGWCDRVWTWCRNAAEGEGAPFGELRDLAESLQAAAGVFAPILRDRSRRQRLVEGEREDAIRDRDSALRVYRETDQRLHEAHAAREALQERFEDVIRDRDSALRVYRETDQRLHEAHAAREALQERFEIEKLEMRHGFEAQHAQTLEIYRRTDELLRQTQQDYQHRDREYLEAHAALEAVRRELESVHASHSWRLTAPLRSLMRRIRGDVPWWPLRSAKPAAQAPARSSAGAETVRVPAEATDSPGYVAESSAPLHRSHAQLRAFLVAEFGEGAAIDATLRIDRYHLPLAGQDARKATSLECSEEQAVAWARAIARRARSDADVPVVSIVIPVFNQVPFTLACIDALLAHETRYSFEILIGDDASTDATAAALSVGMPRVRHFRHATNLGFVRNCNSTAGHARGRYVVFLNNDTQVLPGWLDELVGTLETGENIGLVGSKLVYPDGRLQECGAIVWRDGSAWNFGRLADPRRPEFCYLRDTDYVSGASIALRRDLWCSLGGFDEAFVPAYAEDADLAFRVRSRGLRTVVQPLSQVLHFEGISSGTDLASGAKAYQVENLRKLHARWAHVLATHRDNGDHPEAEKERDVRKRVLFVDHCTPTPNEDAGSVVAFEVMRAFIAHGYKVTFIPEDNFAHVGPATRDLQRIGIEPIYHPAYSRMRAFLEARDDPFDVIFLHRFGVGEAHLQALRRKYPRARVVFLNADMHHLRELREAELSGDDSARQRALKTRERELRVIGEADVTLVHSDFEQALLLRDLPGKDVSLFPLIQDPVLEPAPLEGRTGVCFVGGFRHPPNVDGIRWFVDQAWPVVLREVPDAKLFIVGSHMPPEVKALGVRPGVEAVGFVSDLGAFLDGRRVSVAPLRYGAGAKGKVAAALAHGLPAVCTPIAAEGMGLEDGLDVLVGATPEALAAHVVDLLRNDSRWRAFSEAGMAFAHEVTSRQRAHERIGQLLARLN
jgi:GT2 family glycosyltransferase